MESIWSEMKGFFFFLVAIIAVMVIVIGGIAWTVSSHECSTAQNQYGKPTKYHFLGGGCYIKVQGHSILLEQYANFKQVEK